MEEKHAVKLELHMVEGGEKVLIESQMHCKYISEGYRG